MIELPPVLAELFEGRVSVSASELAPALRMSTKTLLAHARAGNIRYIQKGFGDVHPRREFTPADVLEFLERQTRRDSPPIRSGTLRSSGTNSSHVTVGFTQMMEERRKAKAAPSSGKRRTRPKLV
ncbi:hypothetical protein [Phreatobacter stygius]|uniref:Helix-turn-helix domain-containing protein n=1 Tax=Phreatobacter stygius TaxID=1940610 RepID=A0A4D7BME7_9HYPH|nr:hypothetical protein [Phreatobacter stygius]QCI68842.1 hypothetical protein E8M01_34200 [Phreatobacter stygius]